MESASESPTPPPIEPAVSDPVVNHAVAKSELQSADSQLSDVTAALGPLEGGRWRPVRPDELLKKNVPPPKDDDSVHLPKVRLQRRQELEQHLKLRPTDLEAYLELARIYRADDRPIEAKRVLQQAIQTFPSDDRLVWEMEEATLARSRQQLRDVTEVVSRLNTPEANRELKRSQTDWACRRMDVCRARLSRDPSQLHLRLVLAEAMFDSGMFEGAVDELKPILDVDELSPQANLLSGRATMATGKDLEAMSFFRAASLRRAVPAPIRVRITALRFLVEIASRLGTTMTLARYQQQLAAAEQELSKLPSQ